ncbi:major capsid protein [Chicken microvirus mg8_102]|nr:major capsid protein [Chicken microvirus mg8_102]
MKRSKFNLTHLHSTTGEAGFLIPFFLQSTLPGDRYRLSLTSFVRAQPMLAPLMHQVKFYTQYWFVPYRILWDNWEEFITGGQDLTSAPNFPVVTSPAGGWQAGSLADYFGFPIKQAGIEVSAMPFRAMAEIWNTRYRDEDIQPEVAISYADGKDTTTSTTLLSPSWKRDYFTTARPFTQRGTDITVPITSSDNTTQYYHKHQYTARFVFGLFDNLDISQSSIKIEKLYGTAHIYNETFTGTNIRNIPQNIWNDIRTAFLSDSSESYRTQLSTEAFDALKSAPLNENRRIFFTTGTLNFLDAPNSIRVTLSSFPVLVRYSFNEDTTVPQPGADTGLLFDGARVFDNDGPGTAGGFAMYLIDSSLSNVAPYDMKLTIYATLSQSGQVSIRDLRASSALQRYAERSLQWGNRYEEFIQREFGIKPRDSRIQRPEYLGGGSGNLQISEVLQTAEGADTGVGTMRGHAVAGVGQRPIKFTCPEHGLIIGLISIRPVPVYTQGIEREFLKRSRLDFFTPELANIGMQEVLQQELYATAGNKDVIFGYSDRYQEYRYRKPMVTGQFRTDFAFWNMARQFSQPPALNPDFLDMSKSRASFKRPFAVQSDATHSFLMMLRNNVRAWRPIPKRAKNILR